MFGTWLESKLESKERFHWELLKYFPAGVRIIGRREEDEDGKPRYHAVIVNQEEGDCTNRVISLPIEGEMHPSHIERPIFGKGVTEFLENRRENCSKGGDLFGSELLTSGRHMKVWGTGRSGKYVHVVLLEAGELGASGIRSGHVVWTRKPGLTAGVVGWEKRRVSEAGIPEVVLERRDELPALLEGLKVEDC